MRKSFDKSCLGGTFISIGSEGYLNEINLL